MRRARVTILAAAAISMLAGPVVTGPILAGSALASVPANPAWQSSDPMGSWNNGGYVLNNNEWNGSAGPQTIWADSYRHWGVASNQPAGNTAIETYPDVQKVYNNPRVWSFHTIRNGFTESMPSGAGLSSEAADDIWLNNYNLEVMIWVDNHGQKIYDQVIGHTTVFGQHFTVYRNGTEFIFALNHNETHGKTHILASIAWLMRHGYVPHSATLTAVEFGWEIASTNGHPMNFKVSNYWVRTAR